MTISVLPEQYEWVTSQDSVEAIVRLLSIDAGPRMTAIYPPYHRYTLSSLRGLGKEIWEGVDPRGYIRRLRDEWDR
jgi:hypothetical protein